MADSDNGQTEAGGVAKRDRGPSFPYVGLEKAVERTRELYAKAKRFEVRVADAAADWSLGPKSSATFQTIGALLAYGLIEDSGSGEARKIKVSESGRRILEDDRPGAREALLAEAAVKPKLIAEFATIWKEGRPDDSHAISDLKFDRGFTDDGARKFLRIFDEAMRFTGAPEADKNSDTEEDADTPPPHPSTDSVVEMGGDAGINKSGQTFLKQTRKEGIVMEGERELTTGLLSKVASFRLIVSGRIGQKELERLIQKLQLDKEILADDESTEIEEVINTAKGGGGGDAIQ